MKGLRGQSMTHGDMLLRIFRKSCLLTRLTVLLSATLGKVLTGCGVLTRDAETVPVDFTVAALVWATTLSLFGVVNEQHD